MFRLCLDYVKKGFIIVKAFEEGKGKIIIIAVKNFLNYYVNKSRK